MNNQEATILLQKSQENLLKDLFNFIDEKLKKSIEAGKDYLSLYDYEYLSNDCKYSTIMIDKESEIINYYENKGFLVKRFKDSYYSHGRFIIAVNNPSNKTWFLKRNCFYSLVWILGLGLIVTFPFVIK